MATGRIFKTVQASAVGDTTVWKPNAGKSFKLTGFHISVPPHAIQSARGPLTITLRDAAKDMGITFDVFVGQTAPNESASSIPSSLFVLPWVDLGQGMISDAPNNPLNVNLSGALSSGAVRVTVSGLEV